ncbi:MAG: hypothetical protein HY898_08160 [Deltaproteobacteria bacterium]|nr:hypothetical protein [Deltaproteobacteria bacterium]
MNSLSAAAIPLCTMRCAPPCPCKDAGATAEPPRICPSASALAVPPAPTSSAVAPIKDPPGPAQGSKKVVRGGAFKYDKDQLLSAGRTFDSPTVTFEHVGFRCALDAPH